MFGKISSLRIPLPADTRKMVKAGKYVGGKWYDQFLGETQAIQLQTEGLTAKVFNLKKTLCFVVVTGLANNLLRINKSHQKIKDKS